MQNIDILKAERGAHGRAPLGVTGHCFYSRAIYSWTCSSFCLWRMAYYLTCGLCLLIRSLYQKNRRVTKPPKEKVEPF
jgi:hypothetical protein